VPVSHAASANQGGLPRYSAERGKSSLSGKERDAPVGESLSEGRGSVDDNFSAGLVSVIVMNPGEVGRRGRFQVPNYQRAAHAKAGSCRASAQSALGPAQPSKNRKERRGSVGSREAKTRYRIEGPHLRMVVNIQKAEAEMQQ